MRKDEAAVKQLFPSLLQNTATKNQVGRRILDGTFAHAYVIGGPRGTGKRHFAHLIAAALSCLSRDKEGVALPCGECEFCRKILMTGTPDLTLISRGDAATIGIDAVRRIREDMYLSPAECERKVYIIEDADTMTAAAQNALLIALEEPPKNVLILLLCKDPSLLLPTVRSRVQTLRTERFTREELDAFLGNALAAKRLKESDASAYDAILTAAHGAPGEALRLLEKAEQTTLLQRRETVTSLLTALSSRAGFGKLHSAVGKLPAKRAECIEELQLFLLAVRDMILYKRDPNCEMCFFASAQALEEMSDLFSLRRLFAIFDIISGATNALTENANLQVTLTAMCDALRAS